MPKFWSNDRITRPLSSPFLTCSWWLLSLACMLCIVAPPVLAGELDCRTIESTGGRLACYDAALPPKVKKPATVETDASRAALEDPFAAEEARTAAKLKNICRGC